MKRLLLCCCVLLSGCAAVMNSAQQGLSRRLESGVLGHDDPTTVAQALPAYLVLVDGLIEGAPKDVALACTGAKLYAAYAGTLVESGERAQRLAARARRYASAAVCAAHPELCTLAGKDYDQTRAAFATLDTKDLPLLVCYGTALATDVQVRTDDWNAIAEIPKIRLAFERILELDRSRNEGVANLYLGVLNTLLPEAYGGKPEVGRQHFEAAVAATGGRDLMVKVMYAERYARLVFDRDLHDRLLAEVLAAPTQVPGLTLGNTLAVVRARELLASADDYF